VNPGGRLEQRVRVEEQEQGQDQGAHYLRSRFTSVCISLAKAIHLRPGLK
jgi:hypothetical protein